MIIDGGNVFQFDEGADTKEVARFLVTVTNICENCDSPAVQSDFHKYYEVLDFQSDIRYDFRPADKGIVRPRPAMCEIVRLGKTASLDEFFSR